MDVLFRTITGSRLYGLANDNSDFDYYTVIPTVKKSRKRYVRQTIRDGVDSVVVDMSTFMAFCDAGVPQALEAMFSTVAEIDSIADFRASYFVNLPRMVATYRRTIKNFASGNLKQRRHALRLAINLNEAMSHGRFDPRLGPHQASAITAIAKMEDEWFYYFLEKYNG
jgi:hypothetical protein